jgi:dynein heavy chain 1
LAIFEGKYVRLKDERDNVAKAKEALELQDVSVNLVMDDKMVVVWEELQDLKGVWSELAKIWEQIYEMKDSPWLSVQPRKLRQQIDGLIAQLKDLPARRVNTLSYPAQKAVHGVPAQKEIHGGIRFRCSLTSKSFRGLLLIVKCS